MRALLALGLLIGLAAPAAADVAVCNRTSYLLDVAIAFESGGAAATRGWFAIEPGQCRAVLQGDPPGERLLLHASAPPVYSDSPFARAGHAELCVSETDFLISGGACTGKGERKVRFTEIKPSQVDGQWVATLAEEADYSAEQSRLAAIQRLLAMAGYEPGPVDGIAGALTDAAVAQFSKDAKLGTDAAASPAFLDALVEAAKKASGNGLVWCNETSFSIMAALGLEEKGALVTRGWYRIEAGRCFRPDIAATKIRRIYSFAEAVDAQGLPVRQGDALLAWGGGLQLCTRNTRFEISDHANCTQRGLTVHGFAGVSLDKAGNATVRFRTGR